MIEAVTRPTCVDLRYGRGTIPLELDPQRADFHILRPDFVPAHPDPHAAFREAVRAPIDAPALRDAVQPHQDVVIVTSDGTRPVPNRQLIPWILEETGVPDHRVTVLIGTGSHRGNTPGEIREMFGEELSSRLRIVNHDAFDRGHLAPVGHVEGTEVTFNRQYLDATRRIVIGFIEPHLVAGFSGGPKGVMPAVAGIDTILEYHNFARIASPASTWGNLDGNPTREFLHAAAALAPPHFLVNVTLNGHKQITGVHAGHYERAHRVGCEAARRECMIPLEAPYPIVVASNAGYPLDQNLYQTVKAITIGGQIVAQDGRLLVASECSKGLPDGSRFAEIWQQGRSAAEVLDFLRAQPRTLPDQWCNQDIAQVAVRARVGVYSSLPPEKVRACHLEPVEDLARALDEAITDCVGRARVALLPEGPLTIPFVREPS